MGKCMNEHVKCRDIRDIKKGDTASIQRTISPEDIIRMAEISGDYNPIHLDEAYAQTTRFKKVIAHGLFCAAMVSALLGNELPGLGTILISESMRYLQPVYAGDTITAAVSVTQIDYETKRIALSFSCKNQENRSVMDGEVEAMLCSTDE